MNCSKSISGGFAGLGKKLKDCGVLMVWGLREIFDESAYARFLTRNQFASSTRAYAAFLREYEHVKARRPRCC